MSKGRIRNRGLESLGWQAWRCVCPHRLMEASSGFSLGTGTQVTLHFYLRQARFSFLSSVHGASLLLVLAISAASISGPGLSQLWSSSLMPISL